MSIVLRLGMNLSAWGVVLLLLLEEERRDLPGVDAKE